MSKKKQYNNAVKKFNTRLDITTNDNSIYHIRKNRVYICKSDYYGKVYTITSNKYNKKNVHIIREFYDNDQNENRLRFRILNLKNAKKFKTIEKLPDGKERKIAVIEDYDDSSEYICSIGNIKEFKSDIEIAEKTHVIDNIKILKLVLPKEYFDREEHNKKVA
jgi:hypothetical protein